MGARDGRAAPPPSCAPLRSRSSGGGSRVEPTPEHRVVDLGMKLHAPGRRARSETPGSRTRRALRAGRAPVGMVNASPWRCATLSVPSRARPFRRAVHRLDRVVAELVEPVGIGPPPWRREYALPSGRRGRCRAAAHRPSSRAASSRVPPARSRCVRRSRSAVRRSLTTPPRASTSSGNGSPLFARMTRGRPPQACEQVRNRPHVDGRDVGHEQHGRVIRF